MTIGINDFNQILVVVYTLRHNKYRIISARKANKRECQQYLNQSL
ncbi:BrnT family toxin [Gloeothece verrucosa]|nr:BrnT family toxin [Gloeothece verrucosa]